MNMQTKIETPQVGISKNGHWNQDLPYRAIVPIKKHPTGTILYQVAGSNKAPSGAEKALRAAVELHGGDCFYCKKALAKKDNAYQWTLDHIEPLACGGKDHLANYAIACQSCNAKKGHKPIDSFNAQATEAWLLGLKKQIDGRLKNLRDPITPPSSQRPPLPGAATGL